MARTRFDPEAGQPGQVEDAAHFGVPRGRLGLLLEQRDVVHEREGGKAAREAGLLRLVAEPAADAGAVGRHARVQAPHAHPSPAGRQRGGQQPQQRGLAGAVGAEQPGHAGFQGPARRRPAPGWHRTRARRRAS
jgi:hypothetical protein